MNAALYHEDHPLTPPTDSTEERAWVKLGIVWLLMLPLILFWMTQLRAIDPVQLSVLPVAPKAGDPVVATVHLNNPTSNQQGMNYEFFKDGQILVTGVAEVEPGSTRTFQFAQKQPYQIGSQSSFTSSLRADDKIYVVQRGVPEYPALVLSSFVSFAVSSTTLMSSIVSMSYYQSSFVSEQAFDIGLALVLSLLGLSLLRETAFMRPAHQSRAYFIIDRLSQRFQPMLVALAIIFGGIGITRIMLLLGVLS